MSQSVFLSTCLSVCISVCLSVCLSVFLSISLSPLRAAASAFTSRVSDLYGRGASFSDVSDDGAMHRRFKLHLLGGEIAFHALRIHVEVVQRHVLDVHDQRVVA